MWSHENLVEMGVVDHNRRPSMLTMVKFHKEEVPAFYTFAVIFLRAFIGYVLHLIGHMTQLKLAADLLLILDTVVYVTCCLDPVIFLATQRIFREAFMDIICCVKEEADVEAPERTESQHSVVVDFSAPRPQRNRAFSMAAATHGVRPAFY